MDDIDNWDWAVLCVLNGKVVHIVIYESNPINVLDELREELATDEEFSLCEVANQLEFKIINKHDTK